MFGKNPGTDETWKRIPENSIGAELGVWKGDSSAKFLKRAKHIHLVDAWAPEVFNGSNEFGGYDEYLQRYSKLTGEATTEGFVKYYNNIYQGVVKRFANSPITIHRMSTATWFDTFKDKLDWIYVDASHSYEGCLYDLSNAIKFIKPGGKLLGDDYGPKKPGVKNAVDTFIKNTGHKLNNFHADQFEVQL
tara:strand:- start:1429 stop:1998 length:570 start_codon:yes stop_codon:yes gene_type:complete